MQVTIWQPWAPYTNTGLYYLTGCHSQTQVWEFQNRNASYRLEYSVVSMPYIAFARQWQQSVLVIDNFVMFWRTVWTPALWSPQPTNWTCCTELTIFTEHAQARNAAGQPNKVRHNLRHNQSQIETVSRVTHPRTHRARSSLTSLIARNVRPTAPTGLPIVFGCKACFWLLRICSFFSFTFWRFFAWDRVSLLIKCWGVGYAS